MSTVTVLQRDWLDAAQAVKLLGKSERSLRRLVQGGHLRSKRTEDGTVYHGGDLERIKADGVPASRVGAEAGEEPRRRVPGDTRHGGEVARSEVALAVPDKLTEFFERIVAIQAATAATSKLWLSLDEAAAYSGLARADLLELCRQEKPPFDVRKSGGWKIRRASLEEYAG